MRHPYTSLHGLQTLPRDSFMAMILLVDRCCPCVGGIAAVNSGAHKSTSLAAIGWVTSPSAHACPASAPLVPAIVTLVIVLRSLHSGATVVRAAVHVWLYVAALFVALSLAITILCGSIGGPASGGGKGWERSRRVLAKSVYGCNSAISGRIESLWHWSAVQVGLTAPGNLEIARVRAG